MTVIPGLPTAPLLDSGAHVGKREALVAADWEAGVVCYELAAEQLVRSVDSKTVRSRAGGGPTRFRVAVGIAQ